MQEHAVHDATSVLETPVLDLNVYLLYKQNKDFLEGKGDTPMTHIMWSREVFMLMGFLGVIAMLLFPIIVGMNLVGTIVGEGMVLLGIAALVTLVRMRWLHRQRRRTPGVVIPGTVVQAETIRVPVGRSLEERVRLRYRFELPDGIVQEGLTEAANTHANSVIAPSSGTPVRVWYIDNEKFYLL